MLQRCRFPSLIVVLSQCFCISDHGIACNKAVSHSNAESGHFYSLDSTPQPPFDFVVNRVCRKRKSDKCHTQLPADEETTGIVTCPMNNQMVGYLFYRGAGNRRTTPIPISEMIATIQRRVEDRSVNHNDRATASTTIMIALTLTSGRTPPSCCQSRRIGPKNRDVSNQRFRRGEVRARK